MCGIAGVMTAIGRLPDPGSPKTVTAGGSLSPDRRPVWFENGPAEADILDRVALPPNTGAAGLRQPRRQPGVP